MALSRLPGNLRQQQSLYREEKEEEEEMKVHMLFCMPGTEIIHSWPDLDTLYSVWMWWTGVFQCVGIDKHKHTHTHTQNYRHSGRETLSTKALCEVICWYVWYAPLRWSFHNPSHQQHINTLKTQVHNSASWHPAQACWYFRGVCFSVLRFQPNTNTFKRSQTTTALQGLLRFTAPPSPLSFTRYTRPDTHIWTLLRWKTSRGKQYSQAPWGVSKRSDIWLTAWWPSLSHIYTIHTTHEMCLK